jgi:hypothetical protein
MKMLGFIQGLYVNYYKAFLKDRQLKFVSSVWKEHMVKDGGKRSFIIRIRVRIGMLRHPAKETRPRQRSG